MCSVAVAACCICIITCLVAMCSLLIAAVRLCLLYWAVLRLVAPDGLLLLAPWRRGFYFVGLINLIAAECRQLPTVG